MFYKGRLRVAGDEGDGIPVDLSLDDVYVDLRAVGGEELGRWRMDVVEVTRLEGSDFRLVLDGEDMVFRASDPLGFAYNAVTTIDDISSRLRKRRRGLFRRKSDTPKIMRGAEPEQETEDAERPLTEVSAERIADLTSLLPPEETVDLPPSDDDLFSEFSVEVDEDVAAVAYSSDETQIDATPDTAPTGVEPESTEDVMPLESVEFDGAVPDDLETADDSDVVEMDLVTDLDLAEESAEHAAMPADEPMPSQLDADAPEEPESSDEVQPVEAARGFEAAEEFEPAGFVEDTEHVEESEPTESGQDVEPVDSSAVEMSETAETAESAQSAEPMEPSEPIESDVAEGSAAGEELPEDLDATRDDRELEGSGREDWEDSQDGESTAAGVDAAAGSDDFDTQPEDAAVDAHEPAEYEGAGESEPEQSEAVPLEGPDESVSSDDSTTSGESGLDAVPLEEPPAQESVASAELAAVDEDESEAVPAASTAPVAPGASTRAEAARKRRFFGRNRVDPEHEHQYDESRTVGGITRRVCAVCGHVSFAGEDLYEGWK